MQKVCNISIQKIPIKEMIKYIQGSYSQLSLNWFPQYNQNPSNVHLYLNWQAYSKLKEMQRTTLLEEK